VRPLKLIVRRFGYIVFIPDLTHYPGADKWAVPLRAVGWLEYPEPYTTGSVPAELAAKLWALVASPLCMTLGIYSCSFCREYEIGQNSTGVIWSRELFIPGDAEVFVAPGGVIHYVESHLYLPPARFIDAVMKCPDPGSAAYSVAIVKSNAGAKPPFPL
jgi:hypothetical protein